MIVPLFLAFGCGFALGVLVATWVRDAGDE